MSPRQTASPNSKMDYLFTKQDTILVLSFLVYGGLGFVQLQKLLIGRQFGQSIPLYKSFWIVGRTFVALSLCGLSKILLS